MTCQTDCQIECQIDDDLALQNGVENSRVQPLCLEQINLRWSALVQELAQMSDADRYEAERELHYRKLNSRGETVNQTTNQTINQTID